MIHTLRILCRPELRDGFALAGLRCVTAGDGAEAAAALERLAALPEPGVVLIEERLQRQLPEALRADLERRDRPILIAFPGPDREARPSAEHELTELLRNAIGYRIRFR